MTNLINHSLYYHNYYYGHDHCFSTNVDTTPTYLVILYKYQNHRIEYKKMISQISNIFKSNFIVLGVCLVLCPCHTMGHHITNRHLEYALICNYRLNKLIDM